MKKALFTRTRNLFAVLFLICFASCKQANKQADNTRRAVDPALVNTVPFRDFEVDAGNGDTISLPEGTNIYIPGGTFVDGNGKPVNGNVQLHYRAFYTPGEIIASGITMFYDTAGMQHVFSSAGMFEINGTQNGKPVSIAQGKNIEMDFASSRDDAPFSFYKLDTVNAKWNFLNTTRADSNMLRKKLLAAIESVIPRPAEPKLYDASKPVINIDVDISDHPELSGYEGLLWQYAGSGTDPEKNKWIYNTDWNSAKLVMNDTNTCRYNMTLSGSQKVFSTNVFPALNGQNYQEAMNEFRTKMYAFNAKEKERQEKRTSLAFTTRFQRSLRVTGFGIHNCDQYSVWGQSQVAVAEFHFDDPEFENNRENVAIYIMVGNGRFLSGYNATSVAGFRFIPEQKSCIVGVLRGTNKVAVVKSADFNSMVTPNSNDNSVFKLHATSQTVTNSKELDVLIARL